MSSSSWLDPMQDFRAENVKIQQRFRFGEGCAFPSLAGMQISELFITADHAVPCHVYVAARCAYTCVWSPETQSVFLVNDDGAAQRLQFKLRRGRVTELLSLCLINHFNSRLGVRDEEFPNSRFNDTAFVSFGSQGCENSSVIIAEEKVGTRRARLRSLPVCVCQKAYDTFKMYAGRCGVSVMREAVEVDFDPVAVHKLTFPTEPTACSHEHTVHVWTKGPIHQWTEAGGVATLSDAAGNQIRFQHTAAPGNGWDICSLCVKDKTPVEGMEVNMPVCMTAPFQVAFPDCPFPGVAAAIRRARFQERKAEYEAEERSKAAASGDVAAAATTESNSRVAQKRKVSEDAVFPVAAAAVAETRPEEEEVATPLTQA